MEFIDSWAMIQDQAVHNFKSVWHHHNNLDESYNPTDIDTESDSILNMEHVESSGGNVEVEELLYRHPVWVILILIGGYLFVLFFGLLGNFSVLIVVARTPRMSTVTNLFICNLAVADLLVVVFCILPNLVSNIFVRKFLQLFGLNIHYFERYALDLGRICSLDFSLRGT